VAGLTFGIHRVCQVSSFWKRLYQRSGSRNELQA
jgi:hypothetical protein